MKKITMNETYENKNSEHCLAREFDFHDSKIDLAICNINGRYPDSGLCYNKISKELIYVTHGSGKIFINQEEIEFHEQTAILIEPLEKYYIDGTCELAIVCHPAFSKENHMYVEE